MGFNPTFYAGRPKLSEVTIDSDLDMGGRNISGVDVLRAGRVDSPYTTETWPTEELDWGDTSETVSTSVDFPYEGREVELLPAQSTGTKVTISVTNIGYRMGDLTLKIGGTVVETRSSVLDYGYTHTFAEHVVQVGDNVSLYARCVLEGYIAIGEIDMNWGFVIGPKTFDLTGKWLALGIDMKGLAATIKIQGVEMPYSDYAKYFPLAPTELTIPGNWDASQERPVIEVYK